MLTVLGFHLLFFSNVNLVSRVVNFLLSWGLCRVVSYNLLISASDGWMLISHQQLTSYLGRECHSEFWRVHPGKEWSKGHVPGEAWPSITRGASLPFEASLVIIAYAEWHLFFFFNQGISVTLVTQNRLWYVCIWLTI